jgi:hypothetical protein
LERAACALNVEHRKVDQPHPSSAIITKSAPAFSSRADQKYRQLGPSFLQFELRGAVKSMLYMTSSAEWVGRNLDLMLSLIRR